MRKSAAILGVLFLFCVSAHAEWVKEGATAEQSLKDKSECEAEAYREVQKRYASLPTMGPALMGDSTARRFNVYPSGPFADVYGTQLQEEDRLVNGCMQEKGYARGPARPK